MTPRQQSQLSQLRDVLNARIPHLARWKKVSVDVEFNNLIVKWYEISSSKRLFEFHRIEMPLDEIDNYLDRQKAKLNNESSKI